MSLDPTPGLPRYLKIAAMLRNRITGGELRPGDQLPSEAQLVAATGVTHTTVRRAIALLRSEGLVEARHGKGAFVRRRRLIRQTLGAETKQEFRRIVEGTAPDRGLFESATSVPVGPVEVSINYSRVAADERLADAFEVESGTMLLCRRYLFLIDGVPHQFTDSYLLDAMVDGTPMASPDNEEPGRGTLTQLSELNVETKSQSLDVQGRMPTPLEAETLAIGEGVPVFVIDARIRGVRHQREQVVNVADSIVPCDRLMFGLDLLFTPSGVVDAN